ncbi:MAG: hypothetical protein OEV40_19975, partial [Acidimicrobiia bacterium]|nr:hypothetical protein [Acidimicrobiia bacterium]
MRSQLEVDVTTMIARPERVVRSQFGDVAHHQRTAVHRGVAFEVLDDDGTTCWYRQTSRLGPLPVHQEMRLVRSVDGPLINTVAAGPLTGATLTFIVDQDGPERSVVTALLRAELRGLQAIAAPAVRANARRGLVRAL